MKATITKIIPAQPYRAGIVERYAPEIIEATDERGEIYSFISGSLNGITDPSMKKVGTQGYIKWVRVSAYNLPYFSLTE